MEDLYCEKTVKRDLGNKRKVFPVVIITALVIFLVFLNGIPILFGFNIIYFTGMISFGLCYLVYRIIKSLNIEYEISLTNEEFEASKIINLKKKELLASFSIKDCEYIGSVTSDRFKEDLEKADFTLNCTSKTEYDISDDNWYVCITQERVRYNLVFEFDPEMYQNFRRYNPRGTQRVDV